MSKDDDLNKKSKMNRRDFLKGAGLGAIAAGAAVAGVSELMLAPGGGGGGTSTVTVTTTVTNTGTGTTPAAAPALGKTVTLSVNGAARTVYVQNNWTLLRVLRNQFGLFAAKEACDRGECGACTVIVDGRNVYSCQLLAVEMEGKAITTLEGIGSATALHPLQQAWIKYQATECGACAPGQIMSAKALLDKNPHPTAAQIREAMAGNQCVCGQYLSILQAVADVAGASV